MRPDCGVPRLLGGEERAEVSLGARPGLRSQFSLQMAPEAISCLQHNLGIHAPQKRRAHPCEVGSGTKCHDSRCQSYTTPCGPGVQKEPLKQKAPPLCQAPPVFLCECSQQPRKGPNGASAGPGATGNPFTTPYLPPATSKQSPRLGRHLRGISGCRPHPPRE